MTETGTVYLVGAGPGDPGLLTLKGLTCLQRADLVLYDGLVNPLLLRHTSAVTERTRRSREQEPERRRLRQEEINGRMIEAAREGKTVVRLKGGDPFIFGRGGEEAAALAEAGIPFEVVPGITAATAAAEYAGISLTHRDLASSVVFVTGHEAAGKRQALADASGSGGVDYHLLAAFPGTLVFYMGLHRLESIVESLLLAGKSADVPACVISRGTTPDQRTVTAPLKDLPEAVAKAGLSPPSLIVVGECVRQRETTAWFENRPLFGQRVGITRPAEQAEPTIARVLQLGAQPVLLPTIQILPPEDWAVVDETLARLGESSGAKRQSDGEPARIDWIVFTSVNGVRGLLGRLWETGGDVRRLSSVKLAAIGPSTAEELARFHLRADLVPATYRAEALAESLKPHVANHRVLWVRGSRGRDVLPRELQSAGATVEQLVVYRNVDVESLGAEALRMIEAGEIDWIGLSSPSVARSFRRLLTPAAFAQLGQGVRLASISPVTTAAAREVGLPISAEAEVHTWDGLLAAIPVDS